MTQQVISTELAFQRPFGKAEEQILTEQAIEFLSELIATFTGTQRVTGGKGENATAL